MKWFFLVAVLVQSESEPGQWEVADVGGGRQQVDAFHFTTMAKCERERQKTINNWIRKSNVLTTSRCISN
jgi:hypothetical protein